MQNSVLFVKSEDPTRLFQIHQGVVNGFLPRHHSLPLKGFSICSWDVVTMSLLENYLIKVIVLYYTKLVVDIQISNSNSVLVYQIDPVQYPSIAFISAARYLPRMWYLFSSQAFFSRQQGSSSVSCSSVLPSTSVEEPQNGPVGDALHLVINLCKGSWANWSHGCHNFFNATHHVHFVD